MSFGKQPINSVAFRNGKRDDLLVFLYLEAKLFAGPEEARANPPPTPPSGIVASRLTTERAEPKLALEKTAEMTL